MLEQILICISGTTYYSFDYRKFQNLDLFDWHRLVKADEVDRFGGVSKIIGELYR
jgi:hypothetical protein